ncbi:MAG: hypothetical protein HRJ53_28555, partial [Acidobacteria bacterium Pan2503]|nr:hypothetical protein [Candidatus Acidoferrum panamensis]
MAGQQPFFTQRIWGAFAPTTNQIIGVQTSGETPYQSVPNALIAATYAQARLATFAATQTIFVMGHNTVSDGAGGTFAYNPADTSSGCVCTGGSAGTVLTVISVQSGTVVLGQTVCSSVTGLPLATITSFGTGAGGAGTYNLSAPVNIGSPFTFLIDNNSTVLVSADGGRWDLTTTTPIISGITAPSGNSALSITTPLYTFGNATDNPNFVFAGTGSVTMPKLTGPTTINNSSTIATLTVNGTSAANSYGQIIQGTTTPGNSSGLAILAGTGNVSEVPLNISNAAQTIAYARVYGDGHGQFGPNGTNNLS